MNKQDIKITSYAQLAKSILGTNLLDVTAINALLESLDFADSSMLTYNGQDIGVFYKQLPVISDMDVLVKVVLLRQADNFVMIIPQKITESYDLLLDDPAMLGEVNEGISLYAEVYGFDSKDTELEDIIKKAYIDAGEALPAYELTNKLEKEAKEDKEEPDDIDAGFSDDLGGFDEIEAQLDNVPLEQDPDLAVNMEAYKAFKKNTNALPNLIKKLKDQPSVVRENLKLKYVHNILLIKIENKTIYESLGAHPKIAKTVISNAGELIRNNSQTQIVDTFTIKGNRFFVVAEAANNFWYMLDDGLAKISKKDKVIKPLKENVIRLNKSNVRKENRKYKVAEIDGAIVFI